MKTNQNQIEVFQDEDITLGHFGNKTIIRKSGILFEVSDDGMVQIQWHQVKQFGKKRQIF